MSSNNHSDDPFLRPANAAAQAVATFFGEELPEPDASDTQTQMLARDFAMPKAEARKKTDEIKGMERRAGNLLLEIHDRKGYIALGYDTFEEYGRKEFQRGRREMLDQINIARVKQNVMEIVDKRSDLGELSPKSSTNPSTSSSEATAPKLPRKIPDSHLLAVADLSAEESVNVLEIAYATPPLNHYTGRPKVTEKHIQEVKAQVMGTDAAAPAAAQWPLEPARSGLTPGVHYETVRDTQMPVAEPQEELPALPMLSFVSALYRAEEGIWLITCYDAERDRDIIVPVADKYLRR